MRKFKNSITVEINYTNTTTNIFVTRMLHIGQRLIMLFFSAKLLYLNTSPVISESGSEENDRLLANIVK